ncbi:putative hydroxymethylpyrimidine transport system permease protein [Salsuginibacillus halophilus]|uniref:Putative hydroxymethylpyrimidine transport system permease protein n=1 Tax=Salsuginibacillus halophilus TaxID=517424 RepID=A0A2P8HX27_9BACI|nr:ABC transporter permease [Salsuginibacillus halophilus]PSL50734.1 putative hydroxymethylpyrimidine transport system permease protein [Salsuginibacillus halophilus]
MNGPETNAFRQQLFIPGLVIAILLLLWSSAATWYDQSFILPTPWEVTVRFGELYEALMFVHLPATLIVVLLGLGISIVFGWVTALVMNSLPIFERALFPLFVLSQTIPIITLAPIFVLLFGYSLTSKVIITVLITYFPLTVNTFDGLKSCRRELLDLTKTMGATPLQRLIKIQIPSALPAFFSGLKVAVTLAVIGAAVAEWLGADQGLGYFSRRMMAQFDGAGVFAPIVLLSLLGITLFAIVKGTENLFIKRES